MKISIIHPSRGRPEQAFETAKKWLVVNQHGSRIEYILSVDKSDILSYHYSVLFVSLDGTWFGDLKILVSDNHSAIEAINNAAKVATGDLLVVISDDFDCPEHWDTLLLEAVQGKSDFVLKTRDGIQKTLVTLPIMDRKYYESFGYVYHSEFSHMGADVELTAIALMTDKLIYSDLLFEHKHYSTGKTPKDHINDKNDLTYQHGDEVLARHMVNNFGIENPVISYGQIIW
jgi:hypothetical protein